jgi:hypothetical protein
MTYTPWPIIWTRRIVSSQTIARENARVAAVGMTRRRLEREDAERYLAGR